MAFTVTVIDRDELEMVGDLSCDQPTCGSGSSIGAVEGQVDDAVTVRLSPLED